MKKFASKPAPRGARPSGARPTGARATGARTGAPRPARTTRPVDDRPPRKSYGRDDERAPRKSFARDDERAPRKAFSRDDARPPRAPRKAAGSSEAFGDPYKRAARPPREGVERPDRAERFSRGSGFTVTLDPDVARVFRGDASVNKALRLVMQLVQVVEGPGPRAGRAERGAPPRSAGYQGSAEARGFERKPRFMDDEDDVEASGAGAEDIEGEE